MSRVRCRHWHRGLSPAIWVNNPANSVCCGDGNKAETSKGPLHSVQTGRHWTGRHQICRGRKECCGMPEVRRLSLRKHPTERKARVQGAGQPEFGSERAPHQEEKESCGVTARQRQSAKKHPTRVKRVLWDAEPEEAPHGEEKQGWRVPVGLSLGVRGHPTRKKKRVVG